LCLGQCLNVYHSQMNYSTASKWLQMNKKVIHSSILIVKLNLFIACVRSIIQWISEQRSCARGISIYIMDKPAHKTVSTLIFFWVLVWVSLHTCEESIFISNRNLQSLIFSYTFKNSGTGNLSI
jgi:hypothetical protein